MSDELRANENQPPDRQADLARLARRANEAHGRVAESLQQAVANALEVGRALLQAREICEKGKFTAWLGANFDGGPSTARGYMRLVVNWNQVGGDHQRAGDLSQRQIAKLLKGLPRSDGRANPHAGAANQLPAPAARAVGSGQPASSSPPEKTPAVAAGGDPFDLVARLLDQLVAELQRLAGACPQPDSYAQHLLQPLDYIRRGIPKRRWLWDMVRAIGI
ncbi:MAG TPA: hypothetical protein VNH11_10955 [Pirellulales bacterium]|nr:hypothetical protein [Pirellulales bacterium]